MDIATLIGLLAGFGLVLGSILMKSNIGAFIDIPSLMIVVGGTIAATLIMYPLPTVINSIKVVMKAFFSSIPNYKQTIEEIVKLAETARKEGLVSLEKAPVDNEFLKKGCMLAADGTDPSLIRNILELEINYMIQRHRTGQGIFKNMGAMAPAFGMIGTLIGLVQMLQTLDDPSSIGPAMAVALITTFYGALLANLVFIPISKKLEGRSEEETLFMELAMEGIVSIAKGENPRIIQEKLETFLPPGMREKKS